MTDIIIGIPMIVGGLSLAVFLGLMLYKEKSKEPVARSNVAKLN